MRTQHHRHPLYICTAEHLSLFQTTPSFGPDVGGGAMKVIVDVEIKLVVMYDIKYFKVSHEKNSSSCINAAVKVALVPIFLNLALMLFV